MSKLKSPKQKKMASLERDRRNRYGENDKSSRKNITKNKQMSRQAERKAANQPLASLTGVVSEDEATVVEVKAQDAARRRRLDGFRKVPDRPLKDVLFRKRTGRWPRSSN